MPSGKQDESPWLVGVYLSAMAVLTLIALFLGEETKDISLEDGESASTEEGVRAPVASSTAAP
ncbi:hypothetical protein [Streptomyces sp. YKOK-J1]